MRIKAVAKLVGTGTVKIPVTTGSKPPVLANYTQSAVILRRAKAFLHEQPANICPCVQLPQT
jgi:hypothetical protein